MKKDITELFCIIDDFCKLYEKYKNNCLLPSGDMIRDRHGKMGLSEMLTIMIMYHESQVTNFKYFYIVIIRHVYRTEFGNLLSYNRFIELMPLSLFLHMLSGERTGIYFIDSTTIPVCHNKRRYRNKVFENLAASGKTSMGYFHGFKLHVVIMKKVNL